MVKEIEKIIEEMLPLKNRLPEKILIGKLIFHYPMKKTLPVFKNSLGIKERIKGSQATYRVTYVGGACLIQGVFSTYEVNHSLTNKSQVADGSRGTVITKERIQAFTTKIGDKNPIHHKERAIVPGLLLINKILETVEKKLQKKQWICHVRFMQPLFENEAYQLIDNGVKYAIKTLGGKEILRLTLEEKQ